VASFIEIPLLREEISPHAEDVLTDGRPNGWPENRSLSSPIVGSGG